MKYGVGIHQMPTPARTIAWPPWAGQAELLTARRSGPDRSEYRPGVHEGKPEPAHTVSGSYYRIRLA